MKDKQYQELSATIHRLSNIYSTLANVYGKVVEEAGKNNGNEIYEKFDKITESLGK